MFDEEKARRLLNEADVFFGCYDDDDPPELAQELNMNDVWGWACADGEDVSDDELPEVARLFWHYGWAGILYWVSEKNNKCQSEFHDVNRMIEFVRHEEQLCKDVPDHSERAYKQITYTIGATADTEPPSEDEQAAEIDRLRDEINVMRTGGNFAGDEFNEKYKDL